MKAKATAERAKVEADLARLHTAEGQEQKLASGVQQRINGQIARSIQLAAQDKELSYQLALQGGGAAGAAC